MTICLSSLTEKGWYASPIIPKAVVATPIVVESCIFCAHIIKNPGFFQAKWIEVKQGFSDFHRKEGVSAGRAVWQRVYHIAALARILGAMGCAVKWALYLPATIAKTCAIWVIYLIGKASLNAKNYKHNIVHAFTVQTDELAKEAHKRIWLNASKAIALVALTAIMIAMGCYLLPPLITGGFSWDIPSLLPFQTPAVVFVEYASLGLLHGYQAYTKWKNGEKPPAVFHSIAAVLGLVFPSYYLNHEMRLHHSSYGLLMMSLPWRPLQYLGSLITYDSFLYLVKKTRETDLINLIVDNFSMFFKGFNAAVVINELNNATTLTEIPKPATT